MTDATTDTFEDHPVKAQGFSGQTYTLLTAAEVDWFNRTIEGYTGMEWTHQSDLATLDQMIGLTLMNFRYTAWLSSGTRYDGTEVDHKEIQTLINNNAKTVKDLSESLGLNRKARQADGAQNFADWLQDAGQKALAFKISRDKMKTISISSMHELASVIDAFERSDDEERVKIGFRSYQEICRWFMEGPYQRFIAVDQEFIENDQRHWVEGTL